MKTFKFFNFLVVFGLCALAVENVGAADKIIQDRYFSFQNNVGHINTAQIEQDVRAKFNACGHSSRIKNFGRWLLQQDSPRLQCLAEFKVKVLNQDLEVQKQSVERLREMAIYNINKSSLASAHDLMIILRDADSDVKKLSEHIEMLKAAYKRGQSSFALNTMPKEFDYATILADYSQLQEDRFYILLEGHINSAVAALRRSKSN